MTVWWMAVDSPPAALVEAWRATLDKGEQEKADRFLRPVDRTTYTAAHALTRALLAHVGDLPAPQWRFATGEDGKPEIHPELRCDLRFNLAHTSGLVAVAVSRRHALGIDVERSDRRDVGLALAERYFAPSEVAMLRALVEERRMEAFSRLWALKEAFLKATGSGLRQLHSVSFGLDCETLVLRRVELAPELGHRPDGWQFHVATPGGSHVLALALQRPREAPAAIVTRGVGAAELQP